MAQGIDRRVGFQTGIDQIFGERSDDTVAPA